MLFIGKGISIVGCDIHINIEVKNHDGVWQDVPWTSEDKRKYWPKHNATGKLEMPNYFDARNYNLFAVLANVRNGTWGELLVPISEPRGLPKDSSTFAEYDFDVDYTLGDHSFSYVTLKELQDYPWDTPYVYHAWVSEEEAKKVEVTGEAPKSWAAGMNHGRQVSWTTTIRHAVHAWPDDVLPVLETLGKPEDVRLVFGFDS